MLNAKQHSFCVIEVLFDRNQQPFDYRFLIIDRVFERQTGLKQALGKRMRELVPNHDNHWFEIYGKVALTKEAIYFEHYASALNRWYEVYAFPVERLEKKNSNVAILFKEVKELQSLVTAINNPQLNLSETIVAKASDGIYYTDFKGKFSFISKKLSERLGYTQGELVGKTIAAIMHSEDAAKHLDLLERMATSTLPYRFKQYLLCQDGSAFAVKIVTFPIFNPANTIESIYTVVINDSEVQKLESRLQKSERRLSWMTEIISDVFWISDPRKSQILYVSPSFEKIWGRSRHELYRDRSCWIETIHPEDRQRFVQTTANYDYLAGEPVEYRIVRSDGSIRWISDCAYALRDSKGEIDQIVGIARDITTRKQTQLQLERSNKILKFLSDTAINLLQRSNPNEQIANLLNRLLPLLQLKCYCFYLLAEDNLHLRLKLSQGVDEATWHKIQSIDIDKSACGVAFKSQGRLEIENVQNTSDPQYDLPRSLGITAHACYALIVKDTTVGTISFSRDISNSFNAEEITLLRTVTDLVSIALEQSSA